MRASVYAEIRTPPDYDLQSLPEAGLGGQDESRYVSGLKGRPADVTDERADQAPYVHAQPLAWQVLHLERKGELG
jgi:hypothetical protein